MAELTDAEKRKLALEKFKKSKLQPTEVLKGKRGTETSPAVVGAGGASGSVTRETLDLPEKPKKVEPSSPGLAEIIAKRRKKAEAEK